MKVLVLGGAGYIGSHIVRALLKLRHDVVIVDALYCPNAEARQRILEAPLEKGDVRDVAFLDGVFDRHKPDAVVHMCASIVVPESVRDPLAYFDNNVLGSIRVLQAMQRHGCKRLVFSSTAALFGSTGKQPIDSDDPIAPDSPYGWTKAMTETICYSCEKAYGITFFALRYFNACGADEAGDIGEHHEPESHLIPIVLQCALNQRASVSIFGTDYPTPDGTCVRDYIHVNDLASAHIAALEYLMAGGVSASANLGTGKGFSVREVVEAARRVTGHPIPAVDMPRRDGDPPTLVACPSKAAALLKWSAGYTVLDDIIATAWRFHQAHPRGYE